MRKIGLTGGIGSGKSNIAKAFETLGAPVYYADERSKQLTITDPDIIGGLRQLLGDDIYNADGSLNKGLMASQIFADRSLLKQVEAVIHPAVFRDFDRWAADQERTGKRYAIMEAAVLIESGHAGEMDEVWVATAPAEMRIGRTMLRDHCTREAVEARMKNQVSDDARLSIASRTFVTDDRHQILSQIITIDNELR